MTRDEKIAYIALAISILGMIVSGVTIYLSV